MQDEVLRKRPRWKFWSTEEAAYMRGFIRKAPQKTEGTDPEQGWGLEKIGHRPQGSPALHKWHSIRDAVMQDRWSNRGDGIIGPRTRWHEEPLKDGRSRRDVGRVRNVTAA
jgi:hypothetical protein